MKEKDTLDKAISLLADLNSHGYSSEDIKEVIIHMWIEHTDEPLSIGPISKITTSNVTTTKLTAQKSSENKKNPELSTYMKQYKIADDPYYQDQDTYDVQSRIYELNKLIDKALVEGNRKAFMKYSKERNILMLEA